MIQVNCHLSSSRFQPCLHAAFKRPAQNIKSRREREPFLFVCFNFWVSRENWNPFCARPTKLFRASLIIGIDQSQRARYLPLLYKYIYIYIYIFIIQQIVTMPIYGKEALNICHPTWQISCDIRKWPYLEVHCRLSFIAFLAAILKSEAVLAVFSVNFNSLEETFHD